jgi:hypothetical protein
MKNINLSVIFFLLLLNSMLIHVYQCCASIIIIIFIGSESAPTLHLILAPDPALCYWLNMHF